MQCSSGFMRQVCRIALVAALLLLGSSTPTWAHAFAASHFYAEVDGAQVSISLDLDAITADELVGISKLPAQGLNADAQVPRASLLRYLDKNLRFKSDEIEGFWSAALPARAS